MEYIEKAKWVLEREIEGLQQVCNDLGDSFVELVELCRNCIDGGGKIVLAGVGKSGHVGHKIAATLASTGSPAAFMHPVEAMHGDLGILGSRDVLLALSYSGETDELLEILPSATRFDIPIVAVTSDPESSLAKFATLTVMLRVPSEACPFNLAPTTSSTATMAFGDALAMVLMEDRKFSQADYSKLHPAGAIGRAITLRIADVMRKRNETPVVSPDTLVRDALVEMTKLRTGSVLIADDNEHLVGIFTDGDFRRSIGQHDVEVMTNPISTYMTKDPIRLQDTQMAIDVMKLLEQRKIDDIPVVDANGKVKGVIDIQDLPKMKLM